MIDLTPYAIEVLTSYIHAKPEAIGIRLAVRGGGCSGYEYEIDYVTHTTLLDKVIQFGAVKLHVDQASLLYLEGTRIDFVQSLVQSGFTFDNPQAVKTCGCGKSFSA